MLTIEDSPVLHSLHAQSSLRALQCSLKFSPEIPALSEPAGQQHRFHEFVGCCHLCPDKLSDLISDILEYSFNLVARNMEVSTPDVYSSVVRKSADREVVGSVHAANKSSLALLFKRLHQDSFDLPCEKWVVVKFFVQVALETTVDESCAA